jgi:hypothetical protein
MFPGVDGFHWTAGHIIFLCLFFAVVLTIAVTVISALRSTVRDFRNHRAIDFAGTPTSPICPPPTAAAATNSPAV